MMSDVSVSHLGEELAAALRVVPYSYAPVGALAGDPPPGFAALHRCVTLGRRDFDGASRELLSGQMHSRSGLHVQASDIPLKVGSIVLLSPGMGRLWLPIPCRVVDVIDEPRRSGFTYGTLPGHPEAGEERFLLEQQDDGRIDFTITAYSKPASTLAKLAGPLGPAAQLLMTRRYLKAMDRPKDHPVS